MIKEYVNDLIRWGWTQKELSQKAEVSQASISRFKTGEVTNTDYKTFHKVEALWKTEKHREQKRLKHSS